MPHKTVRHFRREVLDYSIPSEDLEYHPTYTIRSPKGREDDKRELNTTNGRNFLLYMKCSQTENKVKDSQPSGVKF